MNRLGITTSQRIIGAQTQYTKPKPDPEFTGSTRTAAPSVDLRQRYFHTDYDPHYKRPPRG